MYRPEDNMNLSIIFALGSMFCAGVNDLIFKRYVSKVRSKGIYLSMIGIVWALIFYAVSLASGGLVFNAQTVIYGVICGFFSIAAQVFFLKSLQRLDVAVGSTIYRLNFILVIILALIFLGEMLTPATLAGSLLAIGSVLILSMSNGSQKVHHVYKPSFLYLAIFASLLRGLMGFFYKVALNHNVEINTFLFVNALLWIMGGFIYAVFFERKLSITRKITLYSVISGLLVTRIVLFLTLALKSGEAIIVVTITQMSVIISGALSVWFLKEKVTFVKTMGALLALGAICLLAVR